MDEDNLALEAAYTTSYTHMKEAFRAMTGEPNPLLKAKLLKEFKSLVLECRTLEKRLGL